MRYYLLILLLLLSTQAYAQDFIVVVNAKGPLAEADMGVVRDIYLGDKKFAGDIILKPVNFTEGVFKDAFLRTVVGMSSKEYKRHWIKKVFQEGLSFPVSMGSPIDIIDIVLRERGVVAYLPAAWAETIRSGIPRRLEDVKVIGMYAGGEVREVPGTPKAPGGE
jgi:hypothetical protein